MKQKIVIKVCMNCDRARSKAMKVASESSGVRSVAIEGNDLDQLVVTGEGIDSACLTTTLRKKVGDAVILKIEEVKPEKKDEKKDEKPKCEWYCPPPCNPCAPYPYPPVVCEQEPSYCSIM
ncbi:hypothetical protein MLD38_012775 [Melastoma candidum]|uniref:Uncharacterized protein n=1 Tax=Melastoma candidum TaxID=119954 RepID=A0ACB9R8I6_9MYRT|nr:hypothetical protein MLD38_012775 [Melastoma candidum]